MILFPIIASLVAIIFALALIYVIRQYPAGSGMQIEIATAIKQGSRAYLKRQNITVGAVALIVAPLLWIVFGGMTAAGFIIGAVASALAGYLGMMTSVDANVRTTEAAKIGLSKAFRVAFLGGSVTGFLVVGLGLFSVSLFYYIAQSVAPLIGLAFGGSLISVFARLGGGIFTKGADVGADLVGKIEAGIPEDDPRNPAVIADNVGDNVGDCAGMAADLFETYAVTSIAAMLLGSLLFPGNDTMTLLPLVIGGISIIASIVGALIVRVKKESGIMPAMYWGLFVASAVVLASLWPLFAALLPRALVNPFFLASAVGIAVTGLMAIVTEYYTSKKFRPVKSIARASLTGHGTNMIMGLAMSMEATAFPVLVIASGMIAAFLIFGLYGIAVAGVAMLSLAGIIVA
ncbi:MAG: sodium/proton-translocating pyrophosphatase, partial [Candidatus Sungiibacteriota bacterium]